MPGPRYNQRYTQKVSIRFKGIHPDCGIGTHSEAPIFDTTRLCDGKKLPFYPAISVKIFEIYKELTREKWVPRLWLKEKNRLPSHGVLVGESSGDLSSWPMKSTPNVCWIIFVSRFWIPSVTQTVRTWKWMVGRLSRFLLERPIFTGYVSFRECSRKNNPLPVFFIAQVVYYRTWGPADSGSWSMASLPPASIHSATCVKRPFWLSQVPRENSGGLFANLHKCGLLTKELNTVHNHAKQPMLGFIEITWVWPLPRMQSWPAGWHCMFAFSRNHP